MFFFFSFWHKCFDYPNYVRIVLTVPDVQLQEACMRMAHFCEVHYVGVGHKGHHAVDDRSLPVGRIHDKTRLAVPAIEPWNADLRPLRRCSRWK